MHLQSVDPAQDVRQHGGEAQVFRASIYVVALLSRQPRRADRQATGDYLFSALAAAGAGFANFAASIGTFARNSLNETVERPSVQVTIQ